MALTRIIHEASTAAADDGRMHTLKFDKGTHRMVTGGRQAVLLAVEAVRQVPLISIATNLVTTKECLDFMIPLNERHLRSLLREWKDHCNQGRPHSSLESGIPDADAYMPVGGPSRHEISRDY